MGLEITRLGGHLGARVDGIRLEQVADGDADLAKEIEDALYAHLVLVFPEQHLDDDALKAFMECLGPLYLHPIARHLGRNEARVEHIVDDADHPPYQDRWHTDVSFDREPPRIGCLQAIEMPDHGGETLWASMYAAYEQLSPPMQQVLEQLSGIHTPGTGQAFASKGGAEVAAWLDEQFPGTEHPVVGTHAVTGRRYLYVNSEFTTGIAGMTQRESDALLNLLAGVVQSPNIQYRHRWTPGEVIMWDERATQHFATSDHYPLRREVTRVTVGVAA